MKLTERQYPHYVKYMGSKSKIMPFVLEGINAVYKGGVVCDLFAGSASLAGAIGHLVPVHSNDIQLYSEVLAGAYLFAFNGEGALSSDSIILAATKKVKARRKYAEDVILHYEQSFLLNDFAEAEKAQQSLINRNFPGKWHLFTKYYSGTWWSAEQCLWIDAIREVAEENRDQPAYSAILASLMYAMAYASQGTGHYAQYRDAKTESSLKDILIYRRRSIAAYFKKKFDEVQANFPSSRPSLSHKLTTLDYKQCLELVSGGTVYADPPYCFVHYSRFYHAMETLVKYDYPEIQSINGRIVKGRYRDDRHQSPFSIRSKVEEAFIDLFLGIEKSKSSLVLSYSNTGMITVDRLSELIVEYCPDRRIELLTTDHKHMTLGRQFDRHREVEECLFLIS